MSSANKTAGVPRSRVGIGIILKIQANNFPADTGDTSFIKDIGYCIVLASFLTNNPQQLKRVPKNRQMMKKLYHVTFKNLQCHINHISSWLILYRSWWDRKVS